ncbi:hypothetical protein WMF39_37410 [Sorangium sp. So ce1504]|uniref:hypothetical protein n=1 Tax=Sorangium sp. So ce1504 TaxID=3133337 RepID=UPI003F647E47
MKNMNVAERLIGSIDWTSVHEAEGTGERVKDALLGLLSAKDPEESTRAYWGIENHVVVQGELHQIAEACTSVLVACLVDPRPRFVRIAVLDLLFQILGGYASPSNFTPGDIVERCHRAAREGLWILIDEAIHREREAARDVLRLLGEEERVDALSKSVP